MDDNKKILKLKVDEKEVQIMQRKDMFTVSLDTVLLVNFIKLKKQTKTLVDFGTNNAAIPILLAKQHPTKMIGVEIQPEAVALAQQNVALNNFGDQITICHEDIKTFATNNKEDKVDVVVCNPPFFPVTEKTNFKVAPLKIAARHEIYIDLATIVKSAANLLKDKGKFFIIYHIERLDELLIALKQEQFSVKRMQVVYPKIDKPANLVLIEAVFKTNTGMIVEPPLICHQQDNSYHREIAKWYNKNNIK